MEEKTAEEIGKEALNNIKHLGKTPGAVLAEVQRNLPKIRKMIMVAEVENPPKDDGKPDFGSVVMCSDMSAADRIFLSTILQSITMNELIGGLSMHSGKGAT